jgi:peptidoglycan/xylan/chitin deacetylase (PgdA/CDA1 family)
MQPSATEPTPTQEAPTEPETTTGSTPSASEPTGPTTVQRLPDSLKGTEWERLPTARRVVALTFDACGNEAGAASILATLAAKRAPATFFLCGRWVEEYPDTARRIAAHYPVGNHTFSHPHLTQLSNAAVRGEVRNGARAIHTATAVDPRPLFRFPYGDRDERTIALVNELGYGSIRWTVDTLGWKGVEGGQSATSVAERVIAALQPGEIVLMHVGGANDGSTLDADALARVIHAIRARGYGLTNVYAYAGRYAHVADDASARFSASAGWGTSSWNPQRYGDGYHYAMPAAVSDPARFRVRVPQTAAHRVYAWWPADPDYNSAARIALDTTAGRRWFVVDERTNGGRWNNLGKFQLSAGDRQIVRIARRTNGQGLLIADAVRITTPRPPGSASAATTLRWGSHGPRVRRLQSRLAALRYLPTGSVDGVFGDRTWHAVVALQGWEGLHRDGVVGPATRAALERARPPRAWGALRQGLELNLARQVMLLVSGGATVRAVHISSGRPGYCTPSGRFTVYRRERLAWSERYHAWMPYALYFYGGYAIHGYPDVPAQPASHGCVRVPMIEAPTVWSFAPVGTRVWIR